jgi:ATP-dependent DNA helicase RecQ
VQVTLADPANARRLPAVCKIARDRGWRAYRAIEAFVSPAGGCRRRALLDHFGDRRPGAPAGRCCDVCDPATIALPDPESLTPARTPPKRQGAAAVRPADEPLVAALKEWRMRASDGKPAYTVAHNSTLESIAALKPATLAELAAIKGVGPAFVERHGEQVLALVGQQRVDVVAGQ